MACVSCGRTAIAVAIVGNELALCEEHLREAEPHMHPAADGMLSWASVDGEWHPARQYYTADMVSELRKGPPQIRAIMAMEPGGARALVGATAILPCAECDRDADVAYEVEYVDPALVGYSEVTCSEHAPVPSLESDRAGIVFHLAAECHGGGVWQDPR